MGGCPAVNKRLKKLGCSVTHVATCDFKNTLAIAHCGALSWVALCSGVESNGYLSHQSEQMRGGTEPRV